MGNDGKFAALTQAYIFVLILAIAYYDVSVIKVNAIVTIATHAIGLILFTEPFLKQHSLPVWIFIMFVYLLSVIAAYLISQRTYHMFAIIAKKEKEEEELLDNVNSALPAV